MRTSTEGQLIERAAFAAVGAVIGTLLGVAFELVRIFFAGISDVSPMSLAICSALGALVGAFAPRAIFIGITPCASFFVGVMSALTPEYWLVRGRSLLIGRVGFCGLSLSAPYWLSQLFYSADIAFNWSSEPTLVERGSTLR